MMFSKCNFGLRLSHLRQLKGISMRELGAQLGISDEAVRLMERGKRAPSIEVFCAIVEYFHIPPSYLLNEPPFEQWESLNADHDLLISVIADTTELSAQELQDCSFPQFIRLFGALFARAEIDPDTGALALYPLFGADERM